MSRVSSQAGSIVASLVVTPEVMLQRATTVQSCIRQLKADFGNLESTVKNTRGYWIGDAGDAHRDFYNSRKEEIDIIFARLTEDVTDLQKMSAVYTDVEKASAQEAGGLPDNVIM